MDPKAKEFLDHCWTLVRAHGVENPVIAKRAEVAWGLKSQGAQCYRDKIIEIVAEADPSKRILVTKIDFNVAVVCTGSDGQPFRWHGEYTRVAGHARLMVVRLLQKAEDGA